MILDLLKIIAIVSLLLILLPLLLLLIGGVGLLCHFFGLAMPKRAPVEQVVEITAPMQPVYPVEIETIAISDIWVEHVTRDGQKGMLIHVAFQADDMKDIDGYCVALFSDIKEHPLYLEPQEGSRYVDWEGQLGTYEYFTPQFRYSRYNDLRLFMPYELLTKAGMGKKALFHVYLTTTGEEAELLAESGPYLFKLNTTLLVPNPVYLESWLGMAWWRFLLLMVVICLLCVLLLIII